MNKVEQGLTDLFGVRGAGATDKLRDITERDHAQKWMAIWVCVFRPGPPRLCLSLGKHRRCSAQAAAAVAAHGH